MDREQIDHDLARLNHRLDRERELAAAIDRRWEADPLDSRGMIALAVDMGVENERNPMIFNCSIHGAYFGDGSVTAPTCPACSWLEMDPPADPQQSDEDADKDLERPDPWDGPR
jgi:hypothetical protein